MQGQSSPVQIKDPYTGSILMHVGSSCKHTGVYNVHLPKLIDGSNKKTKKIYKNLTYISACPGVITLQTDAESI